jgi:hypothetical protein
MADSVISSLGIPSVGGVYSLLDTRLAKRSAAKWPPLLTAAVIQFCYTISLLSLNSLVAWLLNYSLKVTPYPSLNSL